MKWNGLNYRQTVEYMRDFITYYNKHLPAGAKASAGGGCFYLNGNTYNPTLPTLYKFGKDFGIELQKADISEILTSQLPRQFQGCFEINDNWFFVCLRDDTYSDPDLFIHAINMRKTNSSEWFDLSTEIGIGHAKIEDMIKWRRETDEEILDKMKDLDAFMVKQKMTPWRDRFDETRFRLLINALVYVTTGSPDLREYKPPERKSSEPRRVRDRIIAEYGNDECVLVSWGWKKPRQSHTSEWEVSGHFWWAPVGQGRSRRELRWREGHTRAHQSG